MATNDFAPPISDPPAKAPGNILQVDIHAVNQPWGAIPEVMRSVAGGETKLAPIAGLSDKAKGRGRRGD